MLSLPGASAGMSQEVPAMRISGGGSGNINQLMSDTGQFRNEDFVVSQNGAFSRGFYLGGGVAKYTHGQLYNPASSGVTVILDHYYVVVGGDARITFARYDTELTTSLGAWRSHLVGGAAGNAIMRWAQDDAILGTAYWELELLASEPLTQGFKSPIQIGEEEGVLFNVQNTNVGIGVVFLGREV